MNDKKCIRTVLVALIATSWFISGALSFQSHIGYGRNRLTSSQPLRSTFQTERGDVDFVRELGGYERLLSRKTPGTNKVSLSHGTAFIFDGLVAHDTLVDAVATCMDRHPMLRVYISKDDAQKKEYWSLCEAPTSSLASEVISTLEVSDMEFESTWRRELESALNDAVFPEKGPLWRVKNIVSPTSMKSAWVFCFNHGSDDQQSVNIVVTEILNSIHSSPMKAPTSNEKTYAFPKSVEDAIAPDNISLNTLKWSIFQLINQAANTDMLPAKIIQNYKKDPEKYKDVYTNPDKRRTFLEYLSLSREETAALRVMCRAQGVTITNALSAAILILTSTFFQNGFSKDGAVLSLKEKNLRFLLSVGLRPFGAKGSEANGRNNAVTDWTEGTVACASGAVDFVVSVPASTATPQGEAVSNDAFWALAKTCKQKSNDIIEVEDYVPESVRLFGLGMKYADILTIVDLESKNPGTMGRGFACGVSNVGLVNLPVPPTKGPSALSIVEGYYGTSHSRNGVFCMLSSMTVGEKFCGCLQFTSPFINEQDALLFKEALLRTILTLS